MHRFSLGYRVLFAVLLGIAAGLFFGPLTSVFKPLGVVYTMLLQMAVLPYIALSLIHGLGSLTPETGRRLLKRGWPYLLALWVLILGVIFLLIQLIPETTSPLIDTTSGHELEINFPKNLITYLVPENPLYDISHNIVPAIAVFGLIGGIALMHVTKKEPLISALERVNQTIENILHWLGNLSPVGAFVYISIGFGNIHFEDLAELQIFVFAFIFTTLFITFWILPTLISCLTPLSYREAIRAFRYVCLLPFVTALSTTALPFLNNYLRYHAKKHDSHDQFRETSQTVLPIAYSFGNIGNAMILFFIIFLGYYYRHPISEIDQTMLAILTIPLSIGASASSVTSILFLTKQLGLPPSAADFFLEIKSVTGNFQVMMSIASVLTLIILSLYAYYGLLLIQWRKLIIRLGVSFAIFAAVIFSVKSFIHIQDVYQHLYQDLKITDVIPNPVPSTILTDPTLGAHREFPDVGIPNVLKQVVTSKTLKVGYNEESIPFCYYNKDQELVGFDIAYAYQLAADLNCSLEFVRFEFNTIGEQVNRGDFDLGMSSIIMSEARIVDMDFTFPYYETNNALVVPRAKKNHFLDLANVKNKKGFKIGAGGAQIKIAHDHFPLAEVEYLWTKEDLLTQKIDAMLWSETNAVIWCLMNPDFVTISYGKALGTNYFGYAAHQHATDFSFYLNNWLSLKEQSGFYKEMQSYWIYGTKPSSKAPRWSIIRNVLHWIK